MAGLNSKDEGYGVHQVRLSGSIGTDDRGEFLKGADDLFARVGFEIFEFEVCDRHDPTVRWLRSVRQ